MWVKIIERSGVDSGIWSKVADNAGKIGRGLWVVSAGTAAYEILDAENKPREALKQAGSIGGGILAGSATGAAVGAGIGALGGAATFGLGAPVTVGLGVILGGIAGAVFGESVMNEVADQIFGPEE